VGRRGRSPCRSTSRRRPRRRHPGRPRARAPRRRRGRAGERPGHTRKRPGQSKVSARARDCTGDAWASGLLTGRRGFSGLRASKTGDRSADCYAMGSHGSSAGAATRRGLCIQLTRFAILEGGQGSRLLPIVSRSEDERHRGISHRGRAATSGSAAVGSHGAACVARAPWVRRPSGLGADADLRADGGRVLPRTNWWTSTRSERRGDRSAAHVFRSQTSV
jgi:hypothetical protein